MPSIIINKNTLSGGLKSDLIGLASSQEAATNQYVRSGGIDFHRLGFEGHITPAQTFSAGGVSNAEINSLPRAVLVDTTYLVATPRIYYLTAGLSGIAPRVIKTTSPSSYVSNTYLTGHTGHNFTTLPSNNPYWGEDIIAYKVASTYFIFYSWNDNADGDIGRMAMDMTSQNDQYMSGITTTYLTVDVPHRMAEGADGKLYITNGRYVIQFDGVNNTFNTAAYDLGIGWIATDIRKYGNFLAISSVRSGTQFTNYQHYAETQVSLWNMTEPHLGLVFPIADNYISAIFPGSNNELFAFTQGRGNTVKLFEFTGQGFRLIWENAIFTVSPDPRSIELYKGLICWISGNFALALDLATKGVHMPFYLSSDNSSGSNVFSAAGSFLKNTDQSYLLTGGLLAGVYRTFVLTFGSTGYAVNLAPDLRTRLYRLPYKSTIRKVRVWVSQIASGASAQFSIFKNYVSSSVGDAGTDMLNKTISYTANGAITEYEWNVTIANVSSFYMNVRLVGQISIAQIEIDWEPRK